ncbi:MAG: MBL fold metallo-hydrolase [Thermoproteota archaeon]
MLKHIRVVPLAAESLGVRSMCTYVETPDVRVLLDAGVSLCPRRWGLPPHPDEFRAIISCRRRIQRFVEEAGVVTVSHYHFDHHTPSYEDWLCNWTQETETSRQIYQDKMVLVKNPRDEINYSQRRRGWVFQKTSGRLASKLEIADGQTFIYEGCTELRFSKPVFHGLENSPLGWVLMTTIQYEEERFMFTSDIQGPMYSPTLDLIEKERPQVIMVGGPPLYLSGFRVKERDLRRGIENLARIVEIVPHTILEHHILRDKDWRKKTHQVFEKAEQRGHQILTAAEFLGKKNLLLEADRRQLYRERPPSREFKKWMRKKRAEKRSLKPPLSL